ncbi:toll/interleukin-1 receptor domain-containing protein [Legionella sp. CNM-4043-24]|uniref:toll/interleukin-1 receptor domain-containing protein n=1 Tax=Legionella sp. CNM-4043-24 TaxID=3421646 RepID=UPI00403ABA82
MLISELDPNLRKQYETRCNSFKNNLEILKENLDALEPSPKDISIFIWHSHQQIGDINRRRVLRLAQHLKEAGFTVKLDIIDHGAGSISVFLDNIDGRDRAQFILVICTPDVPLLDPGNPLSKELARIEYRDAIETQEAHGIFPVILRGNHKTSVPAFLKPRATDDLNMSNHATYVSAFFKLIQAIYRYDARVVKLTEQTYDIYIEQTGCQPHGSPELEESQPDTSRAASSSIPDPIAYADKEPPSHRPHASHEPKKESPYMGSMPASCLEDCSWPAGSTGTSSSSAGFFYHPTSMTIKPPSVGLNVSPDSKFH